jgi:hypothetical protein
MQEIGFFQLFISAIDTVNLFSIESEGGLGISMENNIKNDFEGMVVS